MACAELLQGHELNRFPKEMDGNNRFRPGRQSLPYAIQVDIIAPR
jgi:hypothetical protein